MKILTILAAPLFASVLAFAAEPPKGFEDPALLEKVMAGQIVSQTTVDTKLERRIYLRAFAPKASGEAWIGLATNHKNYPALFKEIKEGRTKSVNTNRTVFEWYMDFVFPVGPIWMHAYPEGRQTVTYAKDAISESLVVNNVTNYQDMIEFAFQNTRLIPWEGGILIEDELHVKMKKDNSQTQSIKRELLKQFTRFIDVFRKELQE